MPVFFCVIIVIWQLCERQPCAVRLLTGEVGVSGGRGVKMGRSFQPVKALFSTF